MVSTDPANGMAAGRGRVVGRLGGVGLLLSILLPYRATDEEI